MADETPSLHPSLHIDSDWKKQAQEEKRKLAEQEKQKAAAASSTTSAASRPAASSPSGAPSAPGQRAAREMPAPSFAALVQSFVTQVFFYLGDLTPRGAEPQLNLDMAKYHVDILGVLEEKTKNNLTPDETHLLDAALYETRIRFINVSSQVVNG